MISADEIPRKPFRPSMPHPLPVRKESCDGEQETGYIGSLPRSLLKTSVIAFCSSDDNEAPIIETAPRKRSLTWHGEGLQESVFNKKVSRTIKDSVPSGQQLNEQQLRDIMEDVLMEKLQGIQYNHRETKRRCVEISREIHDRMKKHNKSTYKYVVSSFIGEIRDSGIEAASQCVWDPDHDSMVTGYFKNESIFAIATVFSVYIGEKDRI